MGNRKEQNGQIGRKKHRGLIIALVIVLALAVIAGVNFRLLRTLYYNNVDPQKDLTGYEQWQGGTTYAHVPYAELSENQYLNLYIPDTESPAPLFVLVHGGGFILNDLESRQAMLMIHYFRDHGYACATINYRLAQEAPFPAALEDVKAAVRFLKVHGDVYGYTADRVPIWGESAGGYLAVMASVTGDDEFMSVPFIGQEEQPDFVSAKVDAVIDYYGVMEFQSKADRQADFAKNGIPGFVYEIANGWLSAPLKGTGYESCEDYWLRTDVGTLSQEELQVYLPSYYISKNLSAAQTPEFMIYHGLVDITVPPQQSARLYELLCKTVGEEHVTYETCPEGKHASERMYTDEVLSRMKNWLDSVIR